MQDVYMGKQVGVETSSFTPPVDDWRRLLANAATEEAFVRFVRERLALWSPEEISKLPINCRPGRIGDAEDINRWAFVLATEHCSSPCRGEEEQLLSNMLGLVTQAAERLAVVQAVRQDGTKA